MVTLNKKSAAVDIAILVIVVAAFWSLRFAGVQHVGGITMAAGILAVLALLRWRNQTLQDIGWVRKFRGRTLVSRALEVAGVIGASMLIAGFLAGAFFGAPEKGSALIQQPVSFWFFLFDATVLTWVFAAFGEEIVFRGMLLSRLQVFLSLSGRMKILVPSAVQGILFGIGHASQGPTGMIMTGVVGTSMAVYLLTRGERNLIPLVLAHGTIDTIVLTVNWLTR